MHVGAKALVLQAHRSLPVDRRKTLGRRLAELRQKGQLTQQEVAERADFSTNYISEVERGERSVPFETLATIVEKGLKLSLDVVFRDFPKTRRRTSEVEPEPLPTSVLDAARRIAALPVERRAKALEAVRAIVALAEDKRRD